MMPKDPIFLEVAMPTATDGMITVTPEELLHLAEMGEVHIRAQHVRPTFLMKLAEFHEKNQAVNRVKTIDEEDAETFRSREG